jgi:hypothetical protein
MSLIVNSNATIAFSAKFTYHPEHPSDPNSETTVNLLTIGTERKARGTMLGRALCDVRLFAGIDDTPEEARDAVDYVFDGFHWDPSLDETALLNAVEIQHDDVEIIKLADRRYLAWVTYHGADIPAPEKDEEEDPTDVYEPRSANWPY